MNPMTTDIIIGASFIAILLVCSIVFLHIMTRPPSMFKGSIHEGREITLWPGKDFREDILIVDCSKIKDNIVGVKRRMWGTFRFLGDYSPASVPEYPDKVEYVNVKDLFTPSSEEKVYEYFKADNNTCQLSISFGHHAAPVTMGNMPISQNVVFSGRAKPDNEFDHPAGASIARNLKSQLRKEGWITGEIDNWRDCGWSIECIRDDARLQIAFCQMEEGKWMMQISPVFVPGLIGRIFGSAASAQPKDTTLLAKSVHKILEPDGFANFNWIWDGFPGNPKSTSEPMEDQKG